MSEHFEYIDSYFQKQLSDAERKAFEERCVTDESFAGDVAFYISSREGLREILLEQKKQEWSAYNSNTESGPVQAPVKEMVFKKWLWYAAAACIALAIISYPVFFKKSAQELASEYVNDQLTSISQTMDASRDTMQTAISAYNKKDYQTALTLFTAYYNDHPDDAYAIQYIGQTHLVKREYEKAIKAFEELDSKKGYSNSGLFLKGLTLLNRNSAGDQAEARQLFQKVLDDEHLDGDQQAAKWLEKLTD